MHRLLSAAILTFALNLTGASQKIIVRFANGDSITGRFISESATNLVLQTEWGERIDIPVKRDRATDRFVTPAPAKSQTKPQSSKPAAPKSKPSPPKAKADPAKTDPKAKPASAAKAESDPKEKPAPAAQAKSDPKAKPPAAKAKSDPKTKTAAAAKKPAPKKTAAKTNTKTDAKKTSTPKRRTETKAKPKAKIKGKWAHDLRVGLDQRFSIVDQQTFHSRLKSRYSRGMFKAQSDFSYSYGETETTTTADRFRGMLKADVTINGDLYVYGNGSTSFDIVRRIKRRWEAGTGAGYRLLKKRKFLVKDSELSIDLETGAEYQEQTSTRNLSSQTYLWRLGQSAIWQITKDFSISEEIDFFPKIGELPSNRYRAEFNISYRLLKSLSLNFTVLAEAYPETLEDIEPDDLQLRSSLGWTF